MGTEAYCLLISFIVAGIKAVFIAKEFANGMKFLVTLLRIPEIFRCIVATLRLALNSAVTPD